MKRIFTAVLLGLFFLPGPAGGLHAQLTFSIAPSTSTYEPGDAFCLNIEVQDFTDILSMQFSINYDAAFLSYTGSQGFNLPGLSANDIAMIGVGNIGISWLSPDLSNGTTVTDGTGIFQICFEVTALEGVTDVAFSGSPLVVEIADVNGNLVTPVLENGSVTIEAGSANVAFSLPDITASQGDQVCLDLLVGGFTDILSLTFGLEYDTTLLAYTGSQAYNLPNLDAGGITNPNAGKILFSWVSDDQVNGTTVADGASIVQLCFDVTGASGVASVAFSEGVDVEVANVSNVMVMTMDGSVSIEQSVSDPIFILPDTAAYQGDNVCLDVTVLNFTGMLSMQFSINYDTTLLSFTGVQGINLPGIMPPDPAVGDGYVSMAWISSDLANGTTIADSTSIFQICFDVIGPAGSVADVFFSDDPVNVELVNLNGSVADPVLEDGSVTILGGGGSTDLVFSLPSVSANPGDTICLAVSTQGFEGIVSTQYSINYDTTLLDYVNSQAYNLPNFGASNIGEPFPGQLAISWLSDDVVNGTTVPDSTELFELCFEVIGSNDTAVVNFSEIPVVIEISNANGDLVFPTFVTGMVYISMDVGTSALENTAFTFLPLAPNPARELSYLRFELQEEMNVQWRILSLDGSVLIQEESHLPKGKHEIPLNRRLFPSAGTYVVELIAGDYYGTRLLLLTR